MQPVYRFNPTENRFIPYLKYHENMAEHCKYSYIILVNTLRKSHIAVGNPWESPTHEAFIRNSSRKQTNIYKESCLTTRRYKVEPACAIIAKLVKVTAASIWFILYLYSYTIHGVYKLTNITWEPYIVVVSNQTNWTISLPNKGGKISYQIWDARWAGHTTIPKPASRTV